GHIRCCPERIVYNNAHIWRRISRRAYEFLEVSFCMREVERAGYLNEVGAKPLGSLGEADQLQRTRGLSTHGDGDAAVDLVDNHFGNANSFVECHGREITCRAASEKDRSFRRQASVDVEADISAQGLFVDRQALGIAKRRRNRYVAAFELF